MPILNPSPSTKAVLQILYRGLHHVKSAATERHLRSFEGTVSSKNPRNGDEERIKSPFDFPATKDYPLLPLSPNSQPPSTARRRRDHTPAEERIHLSHIIGNQISPLSREARSKITAPINEFDDLLERYSVPSPIVNTLRVSLSCEKPTPIQKQALPLALERRSFIAQAPTGSGKTLAFLIPSLCHLINHRVPRKECRVLIVSPTRELALQTLRQFQLLQGGCEDGGEEAVEFSCGMLTAQDKGKVDKYELAVCTPGARFLKVEKRLKYVEVVVLDEADELLSESFLGHCDKLLRQCGGKRQKQIMMFSATLPAEVMYVATSFLPSPPLVVRIGIVNSAPKSISQELVPVATEEGKLITLKSLIIEKELEVPCLIFVQEKVRAEQLKEELIRMNIKTGALHSGLSHQQRQETLQTFRKGATWVLVCTDLLARGLDCYGVRMVINYDLPTSREAYIHRIGRTGRAGVAGRTITYYTKADVVNLRIVLSVLKQSGAELPANIKVEDCPPHIRNAAQLIKRPPKRRPISHLETLPIKRRMLRDNNG